MLIQAQQLHRELNGTNLCIFDCRFALPGPNFDPDYGHNAYLEGHIPKAQYLDLERDLCSQITPLSGRHPFPEEDIFLDQLQAWGVSPNKKIVIYDDKGGFIAARLWWMLRYWVEHTNIYLLDGGLAAWEEVGLPLTTETPNVKTATHRYTTTQKHMRFTSDIQSNIVEPKDLIIDARAHPRFTGEQENVDPIAGHIPNAINIPCMENLADTGKFLPVEQLKSRFSQCVNVFASNAKVIHSCGSGVTACHNIFAMDLAGLNGSQLYPGSWSEWIRTPTNPVALGPVTVGE